MNEKVPEQFRKLEIYPGYACTRHCRFCFVSSQDRIKYAKPMPFRKMCEIIYKAYQNGVRSLAVLGGEPTLYEKLTEMLAFAKRIGYSSFVIFSNGFRLSEKEYVQKLAALNVEAAHLNLPSHEPEIFDYLSCSKNGIENAVKAIHNLSEAKIPVIAVCVINKYNYDKLPEYAEFYLRCGVSFFMLHYTKLMGRLDPELPENAENLKILIPASQAAGGIKQMTDFCVSKKIIPPFVEIMQPCLLGRYSSRLIDFTQYHEDPESEMMLQPGIDLSETWDLSYNGRGKLPSCAKCIWKDRCYGIDGNYIKIFGTEEFSPVIENPGCYYDGLPEPFKKELMKALPRVAAEKYMRLNGGM